MRKHASFSVILALLWMCLAGCRSTISQNNAVFQILAVESFLGDITSQVVGDLAQVDVLIPAGMDPHSFEPTPQDVVRISECDVLVVNGGGLETWLEPLLQNIPVSTLVITASSGLQFRSIQHVESSIVTDRSGEDPHFWLNPVNVIQYATNIRDELSTRKPEWKDALETSTQTFISQLDDLDSWIQGQVASIPQGQRLLITNHDDLGYFADRYGFQVIGSIIPSFTSEASPSAQEIARLEDQIASLGVKAIFIEAGSNSQIADQVAADTGIRVVTDLYTHSLTSATGPAPTYIQMMKYDTQLIIDNLK